MKLLPLPVRIIMLVTLGCLAIGYQLALVPRVAFSAGQRAPEFIGEAGDWINSPPLTWKALQGKVVLVQFWEYTCTNCEHTHPFLNAWYQRYAKDGLVIIGIHSPDFDFSARRENVAKAVARLGIRYPVLNDPFMANWQAYQQEYWPALYLFDADGNLVYSYTGEGAYADTEGRIQRLLHALHPSAVFPPPLDALAGEQGSGGVCRIATPELQLNPARGDIANLPANWQQEPAFTCSMPSALQAGKLYLDGQFSTTVRNFAHSGTGEGAVLVRFSGTGVNAVFNNHSGQPYRVNVALDGQPAPHRAAGEDLRYDARGAYVLVEESRIYHLFLAAPDGTHTLRLSGTAPFELYSLFFTGCTIP